MSFLSKLTRGTRRYAVPVLSSIGRLISNPGLTLFVIQRNLNYLSTFLQPDNPILLAGAASSSFAGIGIFLIYFFPIAANISINLMTRIPALFRDKPDVAADVEPNRSQLMQLAYNILYGLLCTIGFLAVIFTYPNAYLGGLKLIKWVAGSAIANMPSSSTLTTAAILVQLGAHFTAISNFNTNLSYMLPNFKKGAKRFIVFILEGENRWQTAKTYLKTLGICSFNIISDPCITFFGSINAFLLMPGIERIASEGSIKDIAAFSAGTSFSSNTFTTIPSVHSYLNNHLNPIEEAKIQAVRSIAAMEFLYSAVIYLGYIDSFATGLNSFISVITTGKTIFNFDDKDERLMLFALLCAMSKGISNQAFSVVRGLRDTMATDLYPYFVSRGWITPIAQPNPIPQILPPPNIQNNDDDDEKEDMHTSLSSSSSSTTTAIYRNDNRNTLFNSSSTETTNTSSNQLASSSSRPAI
jgi:hypothetical protein